MIYSSLFLFDNEYEKILMPIKEKSILSNLNSVRFAVFNPSDLKE